MGTRAAGVPAGALRTIEEPVMSDENTMRPGDDDPGQDPLSELLRRMGLNVPAQGLDLNAMMGQFQQAMSQAAGAY